MSNAIEIKNLCKSYGDFTLNNVNLTLPTGTIMGFIGENGAGKSTTIHLMLDLVKKDSGEIKVLDSVCNSKNKSLKEDIGVVLDESSFPDSLTVKNIKAIMKHTYKSWSNETFDSYIGEFSLPNNKQIKDFSKGMRVKLSIAVALSHNSRLLILDEATSGLDPIAREEILEVFQDFIQDETHSVFISSHITSDLEKICDYITFIHKGKIVLSNLKDDLLEKFVILKCDFDEFQALDKKNIIGSRKNRFGFEVLVTRDCVNKNQIYDAATLEDIMFFYIKGDN